jgi:hypothetical protein
MIPISSASSNRAIPGATSNRLTWTKGQRSRSYELKLNGEVVGTLERPSFWSCSYEVETADGRWTFRQADCFGGAEIVDESSQQTIATLKSSWGSGGGTLTFADGQEFELRSKGFWRAVWTVTQGDANPVLRFHAGEGTLELFAGAAMLKGRLSLLATFTYYLVLKMREEAAVLAAI